MKKVPFSRRFGFDQTKPIDDKIPPTALFGLKLLIEDLVEQGRAAAWNVVLRELIRCARKIPDDYEHAEVSEIVETLLARMEWTQIYVFCERVYDRLLTPRWTSTWEGEPYEEESIEQVRKYYTEELNNLLAEENLAYEFVNGQFQRLGRPQTQQNIQRAGPVLADPRLYPVRAYFLKAQRFFNERPDPDIQNCVKEAICALEAAVEILTGKPASKDFTKVVKQVQGIEPNQIPPPIAEGMIKIHSYRGAAQGVAHAALQGSSVRKYEAEFVLSLVAAYITYLYDLYPAEEETLPF